MQHRATKRCQVKKKKRETEGRKDDKVRITRRRRKEKKKRGRGTQLRATKECMNNTRKEQKKEE